MTPAAGIATAGALIFAGYSIWLASVSVERRSMDCGYGAGLTAICSIFLFMAAVTHAAQVGG